MNARTRFTLAIFIALVIVVAIIFAVIGIQASVSSTASGTGSDQSEQSGQSSQSGQPSDQPINTVSYSCDGGKSIVAAYYEDTLQSSTIVATSTLLAPDQPPVPTGSVELTLNDGTRTTSMTLSQTISADGARYANADGSFVFWSKGNGTMVLENGQQTDYTGCIAVAPELAGSALSAIYSNSAQGFSLRLPSLATSTPAGSLGNADAYTVDASYQYQELGPGKDIDGVKFTIPSSIATGTNLNPDSYISVEQISQPVGEPASDCSASLFLDAQIASGPKTFTDSNTDTTYSMASSTGAAVGNRYEETVYAIPGTDPCVAVRYFIHYGVLQNYPAGAVSQFDEASLLSQFDQIRRTLVIDQQA